MVINGKDSIVVRRFADEIIYANDTGLRMASDKSSASLEWPEYKLTSFGETAVIFSRSSQQTIIYYCEQNLLVWRNGPSILFGVPGQTPKWEAIYAKQLGVPRTWARTKTYYDFSPYYPTTEVLTDTIASALSLCHHSGYSYSTGLQLKGADSTGLIYEEELYDAGPNSWNTIASMYYYAVTDRITIYSTSGGIGATSYRYETK